MCRFVRGRIFVLLYIAAAAATILLLPQYCGSAFASSPPENGDAQETVPMKEGEELSDVMNEEQKAEIAKSQEKHSFQAEMTRIMDLIVNSLYTNKKIFFRELLSNGNDACERLRFVKLTAKEKEAEEDSASEIRIDYNKEAKTVSLTDTCIGMTKHDLINNLGTVAKSGTSNFLESLAHGGDINLIGQFGVGFYAAFLVADKVTVTSKNDEDEQYIWESTADGSYSVAKDPRGNTLRRGTRVTLHLKEDATEFLEESNLKELASEYGKFMSVPIHVKSEKTVTEEVPVEEEKKEEEKKKEDGGDDVEVKDDENAGDDKEKKEEKKKTKKVEKKVYEWELMNSVKPIWLRPKEEVEEKEYVEFYKSITKDYKDPLTYVHFTAEGELEFKALLYIPSRAPNDIFDSYFNTQGGNIKLYVRRSFVGDKFENMIPKYLNFIKGVVNSDDVPLNVNREQLQQHKGIKVISKKLVKKTLEHVRKIAKESDTEKEEMLKKAEEETDEEKKKELKKKAKEHTTLYDTFWKEFSKNMKLGCYEDDSNRSKIAKILRFHTSKSKDEQISLDRYLANAKEKQNSIYYISGETSDQLMKSPHMQIFLKKDVEVLFLTEAMDEPCVQKLTDYEGKKFVSIAKGDVELDQTEDEKKKEKKLQKKYDVLLKWFKKQLSSKVQNVVLSRRLVSDPCAVVSSQWGYSAHMEKLMKSQTFSDTSQVRMMANQKIFEINPHHPVIVNLLTKVKANENDGDTKTIAQNLFQAAAVASGYDIENPNELANTVYESISRNLGIDPHADIQEINVDSVEDEEEDDKNIKADDEEEDAADDDENEGGKEKEEEEKDKEGEKDKKEEEKEDGGDEKKEEKVNEDAKEEKTEEVNKEKDEL